MGLNQCYMFYLACRHQVSSKTFQKKIVGYNFGRNFSKGVAVLDIDECALFQCGVNSSCTNLEGTYDCDCNVGYWSPSGTHEDCIGEWGRDGVKEAARKLINTQADIT